MCGIARRRGGRVTVESVLGAGSTFHVWLPRAPRTPPSEAQAARPADFEVTTVLVVEDDTDVREVARLLFGTLGYEVVEATDGESALELLRERPDIGLLATDLGLPGLSGAELARRALEARPRLSILFVSGQPQDLELPPDARVGFLSKPYGPKDLTAALKALPGSGG